MVVDKEWEKRLKITLYFKVVIAIIYLGKENYQFRDSQLIGKGYKTMNVK